MRYFRDLVEIFTSTAAMLAICYFFAYTFPDTTYGLTAWVQAVGSIGAIIAAAVIASKQSGRQYRDAERLNKKTAAAAELRLAAAIAAIADTSGARVMLYIKGLNWDRETLVDIASGRKMYDKNSIKRVLSDLDSVPLHELPSSNLVLETIRMRSVCRQMSEIIDIAFEGHERMNAASFENFFKTLDNAHLQLCQSIIKVESEVAIIATRI